MAQNGSADPWPEIGGYEVIKVIGTGGLGTIYRVRRGSETRALKLMHATAEIDNAAELFRQEARLLQAISSPHVVRYFDCGVHQGRAYLILEWVQSEFTLNQLLKSNALSPKEAAGITLGLARALRDVHAAGIVHRDLKPDNIMLIRTTDGWHVKLIDFNIGQFITESQASGQTVGSPHYMSPEQARGEALDDKTDVFSMGCILHEMLTGKPLIEGQDDASIAHAHATMRRAPLGPCPKKIPGNLWKILQRMLSQQPEERPSAEALVEELIQVKDDPDRPPVFFQLPPIRKPEPPRVVHRAEEDSKLPETRSSTTGFIFSGALLMIGLFVGGSVLHSKLLERRKDRDLHSDIEIDVRVRTPPPSPKPVPSPESPPPNPPPRPNPQPVRAVVRRVAPAIPTLPPVAGAEPLRNGNYRIPHPDDWPDIPAERRQAMCRSFRLRGIYGDVFHQFCDGW